MTRVTLSIEVEESVDPAALGHWLESRIRDAWDKDGEPYEPAATSPHMSDWPALHLSSVEAKPPASGRTVYENFQVCPSCREGFPLELDVAPCCGRQRRAVGR